MSFKNLFFEKEEEKDIPDEKPSGFRQPAMQFSSVQTPPSVVYGGTQSSITEDDKTKWQKFFQALFAKQNDPKPSYHELIAIADAMVGVPDNVKFTGAFAGLKMQGLTRDVLIQTAQGTLKAIQDNAVSFNDTIQTKRQNEVLALQKQAQDKAQQIQKLNQEIIELNMNAKAAEDKINASTASYQVYSQQLQAKIQQDIQNIKAYITE